LLSLFEPGTGAVAWKDQSDGRSPEGGGDLYVAALPFRDGLVVVASNGAVALLDAAGRRLWEAIQAGCSVDDLIGAGVEQGLAIEVARANVSRALGSWSELGLLNGAGREAETASVLTPVLPKRGGRKPALDAAYLLGDRPVRVRCDDLVLGKVIDAACGSYRVEGVEDVLPCVDLVEQNDGLAIMVNDVAVVRTEVGTQNQALARHRCLRAMLEMARPSRQWLGILHASAISFDGRCVAFPGSKGSGKSTLAAAMVAAGADFVSDDYVPLERASWHVWPVPYAPGVKQGSWHALRERYPSFEEQPVYELDGVRIRYLNLDVSRIAPLSHGLPVEALIFPRFEADTVLQERRMSAPEAFAQLCHSGSMLDRQPEILAETLGWIESVPAFQLLYGDLDRAIEWIRLSLRLE